jgi:hypothetical protein
VDWVPKWGAQAQGTNAIAATDDQVFSMSVVYFIVLDNPDPGFDTIVNGKFLAKESKRLDKVDKALGLPTLDEFVSYSPDEARAMMEDLGSDPAEVARMELPEQKWYEAQEGLDLVAKLTAHLRANPSAVKNAKGVLADFVEFKEVFKKAKSIGARWNLQVDF